MQGHRGKFTAALKRDYKFLKKSNLEIMYRSQKQVKNGDPQREEHEWNRKSDTQHEA